MPEVLTVRLGDDIFVFHNFCERASFCTDTRRPANPPPTPRPGSVQRDQLPSAIFLEENGVPAQQVKKIHEGRPHIVDAIHNKEIQLIINTPIGKFSMYDDSYIRKAAIRYKIPYITTTAAAMAAV